MIKIICRTRPLVLEQIYYLSPAPLSLSLSLYLYPYLSLSLSPSPLSLCVSISLPIFLSFSPIKSRPFQKNRKNVNTRKTVYLTKRGHRSTSKKSDKVGPCSPQQSQAGIG